MYMQLILHVHQFLSILTNSLKVLKIHDFNSELSSYAFSFLNFVFVFLYKKKCFLFVQKIVFIFLFKIDNLTV